MTNQRTYKPAMGQLRYVPNMVTDYAMLTYFAALVACCIAYSRYALDFKWMLFGIVEVVGFFYFSNYCSKEWIDYTPKQFLKNIFWWGFTLRVVWVLVSYIIHQHWTGTAFTIDARDELFYDEVARYGAGLMRNRDWHIYSKVMTFSGAAFSDMGYPMYLSIVYWIFGDSILMARIIKALLGAWTAVLIYKFASRNFGLSVGRIAAIFCMLMPNLIYYCCFQLKEVEMVFLAVLFAERADALIRMKKMPWRSLILLMLIPAYMFMIRTALAATLVLAFMCALLLTTGRVVHTGRRIGLLIVAVAAAVVMLFSTTSIGKEVSLMWETGGASQQANMEWRAQRDGKLSQRFAKYAGAAVFAPIIFSLPFPTMVETPSQEIQKQIHGGNYVKNIISYFTIMSLLVLLASSNWRKHVLLLALLCGYLLILVFSSYAHSERFHQPILPFTMMLAAYGISKMYDLRWIAGWYPYWCVLMFIIALAWNWFKLAGRGMI